MKKQLTILFLVIMTVCFSFNTVLGIDLYPAVDGHMNVWEDTPLPVNFMAGIRLSDGMWDVWWRGSHSMPAATRHPNDPG